MVRKKPSVIAAARINCLAVASVRKGTAVPRPWVNVHADLLALTSLRRYFEVPVSKRESSSSDMVDRCQDNGNRIVADP